MGTATLKFCGFSPVDVTLLHAVRKLDAREREAWISRVAQLAMVDAQRAAKRALALPVAPRPTAELPASTT